MFVCVKYHGGTECHTRCSSTLLKITLYFSLNKPLVSGPVSEGFSSL